MKAGRQNAFHQGMLGFDFNLLIFFWFEQIIILTNLAVFCDVLKIKKEKKK